VSSDPSNGGGGDGTAPHPASFRVVDARELSGELTYPVALSALEAAFRDLDEDAVIERSHVPTHRGTLLLMPAVSDDAVGVKLVTISPQNADTGLPTIQASYVLFDGAAQSLKALLDGSALTAIRTAAVSALATRYLAAEDASRLVVFGAGVQAASHVDAMRAVRPIEEVTVVSRTSSTARRMVDRLSGEGLKARVGEPADVRMADVVCTCTTSTTPVFPGSLLPARCHVNAVGAYTASTRELDDDAMSDAGIVVEDRRAALAESGDILMAFGAGSEARIDADLREVVRGGHVEGHHTVFASVGLAIEDLAVAQAGSWAR
jgi:ornithine cyclodeaminase/alanine dehydrogenase-like protein (mu-crystallin family)